MGRRSLSPADKNLLYPEPEPTREGNRDRCNRAHLPLEFLLFLENVEVRCHVVLASALLLFLRAGRFGSKVSFALLLPPHSAVVFGRNRGLISAS